MGKLCFILLGGVEDGKEEVLVLEEVDMDKCVLVKGSKMTCILGPGKEMLGK